MVTHVTDPLSYRCSVHSSSCCCVEEWSKSTEGPVESMEGGGRGSSNKLIAYIKICLTKSQERGKESRNQFWRGVEDTCIQDTSTVSLPFLKFLWMGKSSDLGPESACAIRRGNALVWPWWLWVVGQHSRNVFMNCLSVPADGVFSSLVVCLCEAPGSTNNLETDPMYLIKVITKQDPGVRSLE